MLRKRIPARYRPVADQRGETIKISTGTSDRQTALRKLPEVLRQWTDLESEWERRLNILHVTPEIAQRLAAQWLAWPSAGAALETGGEDSDVFEPLDLPETRSPERLARMYDRIEAHAAEAAKIAKVEVAAETRPILISAMSRVVAAAYLDADLRQIGITGHSAVHPAEVMRGKLPSVPDAPRPKKAGDSPKVPLHDLFRGWQATTVVKPRTLDETRYILDLLIAFLGHEDARRVSREDLGRWRDAMKAEGRTNM